MKRIMITVFVVFLSTGAVAIGSSSGKEVSWGTKSGAAFLANLPPVPLDVCSAGSAEIDQFQLKFSAISKELDSNVAERQRAIKQLQEQNSKKMMENSVAMPGFEGKSQSEMKKMSKAEKKKMAEQMMLDKYGVTPDELKAQKNARKEGKVMANVDWAKAMAGEKQAEDLMKSKEELEADKKKVKDTQRLTAEQSELTPYVQGLRSKFHAKVTELEQDTEGLELQKQIREEEKRLDRMQRDSKYDCHALDAQLEFIVNRKRDYCFFYSPRFKKILEDYKVDILTFLAKHDRLDEVASELQEAQFGAPLSDAAMGLSALETVQDYAKLLGQIYQHDVGPAEKSRGHFCDGDEGSISK